MTVGTLGSGIRLLRRGPAVLVLAVLAELVASALVAGLTIVLIAFIVGWIAGIGPAAPWLPAITAAGGALWVTLLVGFLIRCLARAGVIAALGQLASSGRVDSTAFLGGAARLVDRIAVLSCVEALFLHGGIALAAAGLMTDRPATAAGAVALAMAFAAAGALWAAAASAGLAVDGEQDVATCLFNGARLLGARLEQVARLAAAVGLASVGITACAIGLDAFTGLMMSHPILAGPGLLLGGCLQILYVVAGTAVALAGWAGLVELARSLLLPERLDPAADGVDLAVP